MEAAVELPPVQHHDAVPSETSAVAPQAVEAAESKSQQETSTDRAAAAEEEENKHPEVSTEVMGRKSDRVKRTVERFAVPQEPKRKRRRRQATPAPAPAPATAIRLPPAASVGDDRPRMREPPARPAVPAPSDAAEEKGSDAPVYEAQSIPLDEIKEGDYLSQSEYMKVVAAPVRDYSISSPAIRSFKVRQLRSGLENDVWTVQTDKPYHASSATRYAQTQVLTKTKLAEQFCQCLGDVFQVSFRTTLSEDNLATQLQSVQQDLTAASSLRDYKRVAKEILTERAPTTIIGRMLSANSLLGYSLVDLLTESNHAPGALAKPVFRQINHRDLLSVVFRNVKYVLRGT